VVSKTVFGSFSITGTSISALSRFALPVSIKSGYPIQYFPIAVTNNSVALTTPGVAIIESYLPLLCTCGLNYSGPDGFSVGGTKTVTGFITYETD
jgi:hypothetical protein